MRIGGPSPSARRPRTAGRQVARQLERRDPRRLVALNGLLHRRGEASYYSPAAMPQRDVDILEISLEDYIDGLTGEMHEPLAPGVGP